MSVSTLTREQENELRKTFDDHGKLNLLKRNNLRQNKKQSLPFLELKVNKISYENNTQN